MKKSIIYITLLMFVLVGCNNTQSSTEVNNANNENQVQNTDVSNETVEQDVDSSLEESQEVEEDVDSEEESTEQDNGDVAPEDQLKALVDESDYVSIVRMSQTGSTGREVNVKEDLKGSLKSIVIPEIPNIQPNEDYLIFLMDSANGEIALTHTENGLVLLENENDERLNYVREYLEPEDAGDN